MESSKTNNINLSKFESCSEVLYLRSYLSNLRNNIADSPFQSPRCQKPDVRKPLNIFWHDTSDLFQAHQTAQLSGVDRITQAFRSNATFQRWLKNKNASNIFPCTGVAGSGKTILTSVVIDEIKQLQQDSTTSNVGLAYFYFRYEQSISIRGATLALLEQLYLQSPTLPNEIRHLEKRTLNGEQISSTEVTLTLVAVSQRFQTCYIVIDALDECASEYYAALKQLLTSIRGSKIRLFTTSRPHYDFYTSERDPLIPIDDLITHSKDDVKLYVESRLDKDFSFKDNKNLFSDVVTVISDASQSQEPRMFLYANSYVQEILSMKTPNDILRCLKRIKNASSFEDSVTMLYQTKLDEISRLNPAESSLSLMTLTWVFFAQRPIERSELFDILRFGGRSLKELPGEEAISLISRICMGFIHTSSNILFSHLSMEEFFDLPPQRRRLSNEFELAKSCVRYILDLQLDDMSFKNQEDIDAILSEHPFLQYAANHWGHHVYNTSAGTADMDLTVMCLKLLSEPPIVTCLVQIMFRSLLGSHRKVLFGDIVRSSPLHVAAYFGLDWVIEKVAAPSYSPVSGVDSWDKTPIHIAAERGYSQCVRALLFVNGPSTLQRQPDAEGKTPWHYASMSGKAEVVHELRRGGYPLYLTTDKQGYNPLQYAVIQGYVDVFGLLADYCDHTYDKPEATKFMDQALVSALEKGKTKIVEIILRRISPRYEHLVVAIKSGFISAVGLLLDYFGDLDNPADDQPTALLVAALAGHNDILSFLIRNGVNLERTDNKNRTALACAVEMNNLNAVKMLLGAGASSEASVLGGMNLIVYTASHGMAEILELLLKLEATGSSRQQSLNQATLKEAAFQATKRGHKNVVGLLLEFGVSPDETLEAGQTFSEVAGEAGFDKIANLWDEYGAYNASRRLQSMDVPPLISDDLNYFSLQNKQRQPGNTDFTTYSTTYRSTLLHIERRNTIGKTESPPPSSPITTDGEGSQRMFLYREPVQDQASYILLRCPVSPKDLLLGMIIEDPQDPLRSCISPDRQDLEYIIKDYRYDYMQRDLDAGINRRRTASAAASILNACFGTGVNIPTVSHTDARSPPVLISKLRNHKVVMELICNKYTEALLEFVKWKREVYCVVGLMTGGDSEIMNDREDSYTATTDVSTDNDLGFYASASFGYKPSRGQSKQNRNKESGAVFAIQCRRLRRETRFQQVLSEKKFGCALGGYFKGKPDEFI
ncbi:hypothetical protein TWF694_010212 [Orbilia ellipsospora]|uniref:NACHT domain-containing protein n=1 Tax=Orbilia ellipsospora TaxID=2528407 RepID=A0AAV9XBV0_9PEZI